MTDPPRVRLEPWGKGDLPLLRRLMGDPAMTEHLGGPESEEKLVERQGRYERIGGTGTGRMFKIVDEASGQPAGSVGYWEKDWRDTTVWETGWMVLPEFQGRGIAAEATRQAIDAARAEGKHRYLHAFPSVENAPSNAICRKLGFELLGRATSSFRRATGCAATTGAWSFSRTPERAPEYVRPPLYFGRSARPAPCRASRGAGHTIRRGSGGETWRQQRQ